MATLSGFMVSRALTELATSVRASDRPVEARAVRVDGSAFEGRVVEVDGQMLCLLDPHSLETARVAAPELGALYVRAANRNREGMIVIAGIVVIVSVLTAYSTLPWVRPGKGDITNAFTALCVLGGALAGVLFTRPEVRKWFTEWRQVYPPIKP